MSTLFALFPHHWNQLPEEDRKGIPAGECWSQQLNSFPDVEKALFLDSLLETEPEGYPSEWRRFIRVGNSLTEQVANLFELCFEKGYERVVFADTICAALPAGKMKQFMEATEEREMVLLPSADGSVLMAAMQMHLFSDWDYFRFYESGSIVEIISECHDKKIDYAVLEVQDLTNALGTINEWLKTKTFSGNQRGSV